MTLGEKQISFMNRYFVFRKTHNVNAEKVYKLLVSREKVENTEDTELFVNDIQKQEDKMENAKQEKKKSVVIRKFSGKKTKITIGDSQKEQTNETTFVNPKTVIIKRKKK